MVIQSYNHHFKVLVLRYMHGTGRGNSSIIQARIMRVNCVNPPYCAQFMCASSASKKNTCL